MTLINVVKRDGSKEPLDLEKLHKVVMNACDGLTGVSASELEIASQIQFTNNIKTSNIQETLIKAAADLISEETPNYQYVAGRLINYDLRKKVYGSFEPPTVYEHYLRMKHKGYYDSKLDKEFDAKDWDTLERIVKHGRDDDFTYAAMEQMRGKYLLKDRTTGQIYETPQMAYILISATGFMHYPKETRMEYIRRFYNAVSTFDISLPSPVMASVRTTDNQYSSCVLIETEDTLESIIATTGSIVKYVSQKAGIGLGGNLRALNSPVKGGKVSHTGNIPFFKLWDAAVSSCSQGGIRRGSATLHYVWFHPEVEDFLVLKNNKGTQDNRIRTMDYSIQFNKFFYERVIANEDVCLFSMKDAPDLYEAFYTDDSLFETLYLKYVNSRTKRKVVNAMELYKSFMQERKETGRIYFQNIDNCNNQGPYIRSVAPIRMSNLCQEITEHTKPQKFYGDPAGEIALCTLAAINVSNHDTYEQFAESAELLCRFLDQLLDVQHYPVAAAENSTRRRRHIGIGIINLANWMAKNGIKYQDIDEEGLAKVHELAENFSFAILSASNRLAQEFGPCELINETKWSEGVLPVHTYKKAVDELVRPSYRHDWEGLAKSSKEHGMRFSTHMAGMPSETSSQISNATNGFEPVRALVSRKQSKDGILPQVVPDIRRLKNQYDLLWDQKSPRGYLKICAVFQKFMDQAISVNFSYNPALYEDGKIPMSQLIEDHLFHYKYGGKTGYYLNTNDQAGELEITKIDYTTTSPAKIPTVVVEEDCDGCKI